VFGIIAESASSETIGVFTVEDNTGCIEDSVRGAAAAKPNTPHIMKNAIKVNV